MSIDYKVSEKPVLEDLEKKPEESAVGYLHRVRRAITETDKSSDYMNDKCIAEYLR